MDEHQSSMTDARGQTTTVAIAAPTISHGVMGEGNRTTRNAPDMGWGKCSYCGRKCLCRGNPKRADCKRDMCKIQRRRKK